MRHTFQGGIGAAALAAALLLTGCGSEPAAAPPTSTSTSVSASVPPASAAPDGRPKPTHVRIPKIKAESTLVEAGLNKARNIEVPPVDQPMQAAWYKFSQVPGDPGPAIVLGHVDGNKQPGIFNRLNELTVGDEILIDRKDGKTLRFLTTRKEQVPKDQFPQDAVYGDSTEPELRLITCGGAFDKAAHSYQDNIIIYANLAA
ncbi:Sortase family protein [Actinokineospora alba]|uniref:Sortase family protein n=1 Tax=Actinokineospora alba TaxID=504798 RepID=A0A1H0SRE5_9PSEU|nr:class F sortase [Actinokineospora alba]TDP66583.1 sortase family protein [Actinokineospora alba]SDJ38280.1 Sortase family protein [Actinokineospora alba]SDP44109.1 Sortase family protein [Actinokineospora alba]